MRRFFVVFAFAAVLQTTPAAASHDNWWFKTPGGAAYCGFPKSGSFLCMTPNDGFWIRLTGIYGRTVSVQKGYAGATAGTATPS